MASKKKAEKRGTADLVLAGTAFLLVIIGLVMVYSASAPLALQKFGNPSHYAIRNGVYALLGTLALAGVSQLSLAQLRSLSVVGFWACMLLLALVLIPGIGVEGGGARRWIGLKFFTLQPSEPFKVMLALYLAHLLANDASRVRRIKGGLLPLIMVFSLAATLLMAEPDFGATVITGAVMLGMVFIAGIPLAWIAILVLVAVPAAAVGVMLAPYRVQRVISFMDPWDDPFNSDFQLVQSLLSFGNGGIWGTGLGQGRQKQFYLPESHTDFILAVIGEEMGLFWVLTLIALFAFLVWRAFMIARNSTEPFVQYAASGLAMLLGIQTLANMGVVMGLLPPKGLTLPLVSYGGSSLIVAMGAVGVLTALSRQKENLKKGDAKT